MITSTPAISIYVIVRCDIIRSLELQMVNPIETKVNLDSEFLSKISYYESKSLEWKKLLAKPKLNENIFESNIQVFLLLIIIFLKFTETNTVVGLQVRKLGSYLGFL